MAYLEPKQVSRFWWKEDRDDLHNAVFGFIKSLENRQGTRHDSNIRYLRLYSNYEHLGFAPNEINQTRQEAPGIKHRVTLNIIQSMVDTVVSKITKNSPRVRFLTSGGEWSLKRKAMKLTKFIDGQMTATAFQKKAAFAFLDSCIFGTGAIKLYTQDNEIKAERVFIDELKVDDNESLYGEPRQIHQVKYIHKDVLREEFPDCAGHLDALSSQDMHYNYVVNESDMVQVIESWHLRSGKEAKDGKHSICIMNYTLFEEQYDKDYFPFVFFKWGLRPLGFFGQGLAEQLQGLQLEINKILRTIQVSMHLTAVPKVFVESNSKVISSHLNNEIGGIIKFTGVKPSYESTGSTPSELFLHLDRLYQRAFEIAGISQLSAQSLKPTGLDSGKALREFSDIESERFLSIGKRYEQAYLDAARIYIDLAKDLYQDNKNLSINVKGDKFLETIKWKEIDLEEDQYMMDLFPVSALSNTPSGRLQDVTEMMASGLLTPVEGKKLLQFPDLEGVLSMQNAAFDNIEKTIERIVEDGKYTSPEPFQNLGLGMQMMQEAYLYYQNENLEEERLELIRQWMSDAKQLLDKAAQEEVSKQVAEGIEAQKAAQEAAIADAEANMVEAEVAPEQPMPPMF